MKFVADAMLGRLAKWLRILGFDTIYDPTLEDSTLADICHNEKRTLLTRDTKLLERRKVREKGYFVKSENYKEQIKEVIFHFKLQNEIHLFTICSVCNGKLKPVEKDKIRGLIPEFVYRTNDRFLMCQNCGRIYWKGTHVERIKRTIAELLESKF